MPKELHFCTILCVRTESSQIPPAVRDQMIEIYHPSTPNFVYVNPQTPEELDELTQDPGVVAVYLQDRPLPTKVVEKGETPCILLGPEGKLVRLVRVKAEIEPFPGELEVNRLRDFLA